MLKYLSMAIGFILVIKGADISVNASALAKKFCGSQLVIGVTVIAFCGSL